MNCNCTPVPCCAVRVRRGTSPAYTPLPLQPPPAWPKPPPSPRPHVDPAPDDTTVRQIRDKVNELVRMWNGGAL